MADVYAHRAYSQITLTLKKIKMVQISDLRIYPIKSCKGFSVPSVTLDAYGFTDDRRFMIVDTSGRFVTAREVNPLLWIEPSIESGILYMRAPGMELFATPIHLMPQSIVRVTVWEDTCEAWDCGGAPAEWLSQFLGARYRLVRMQPQFLRPVDRKYAVADDHVSFADAYPALVISEASLELLNSKLASPVTMTRFRPNVVVSGCAAHEEDTWQIMRTGAVEFRGVKRCSRCVLTTVDPETTESGAEPLKTLATYRRSAEGKIMFGMNLIPVQKNGKLRIGDTITYTGS
ncbi:MAG TPA: MOSC N-terminal beta barrel domain-containing protein [bacterium]|nr:MOSC N-terminal beta barrel domain-containing protein [bacterium]